MNGSVPGSRWNQNELDAPFIVRREDWGRVKASDILVPHDKKWEVPMDDDVMRALELMIKEDKGRLVVTEKDSIIGLITRNGIARYVQIRGK